MGTNETSPMSTSSCSNKAGAQGGGTLGRQPQGTADAAAEIGIGEAPCTSSDTATGNVNAADTKLHFASHALL
ncbi:hypothetical protein cyc_01140 [Cyclospora cayetanensis]|uniref:Uncharacterized protein n=1 Tax=Cyclospora cayetanensis TaxID=88456 RepID=A0A1D3DA06_9EIME|nr:hypothetical protein cyc_01140 [Cyclospora cayetanensis]